MPLPDCPLPPPPPPAAPPCENGTAVANPAGNPGLVSDCDVLLAAKDTLRGDAALNWDLAIPITDWEGVTVAGTPTRVWLLDLQSRELTGRIPPDLGDLTALAALLLQDNRLTGAIPVELATLQNLEYVQLGGNQLAGAIRRSWGRCPAWTCCCCTTTS